MAKRPLMRALITASVACAALLIPTSQASAEVKYYFDDVCENKVRCFVIFFNSYNSNYAMYQSPCFLTNRSLATHQGVTDFRYIFNEFSSQNTHRSGRTTYREHPAYCRAGDPGSGWVVKNNAAAAVNNEANFCHTVYYNSGYAGTSQRYRPQTHANLIPALKNDNASSKKTSC